MSQVAQLAGVSLATVSRCLRERPCASTGAIESVRRAASQLGFVRRPRKQRQQGAAARGPLAFVAFGSRAVGATPFFDQLLRGVCIAAQMHGLSLFPNFVPDPADMPSRLLGRGVGGLICFGDEPTGPQVAALRARPTVWLKSAGRRAAWGDEVVPDDELIGAAAARHLTQRGHHRLAYLTRGTPAHWPTRLRADAFRRAAEEANATAQRFEAGVVNSDEPTIAARVADALLASRSMPTGLFVDGGLASSVVAALARRGIPVGADVEVIASGDGASQMVTPTAAARIDVRPEALARLAVEQIVWRMNNADAPERVRLMVEPAPVVPGTAAGAGREVALVRDRADAGVTSVFSTV